MDTLDSTNTSDVSSIISYINQQLKFNNIVEFVLPPMWINNHGISTKIADAVKDMLLNSCNGEITKIDISFNLLFKGEADGDKYTIMKCLDGEEILVIVKSMHRYVIARGGQEVVKKILDDVLDDIKINIIESETLIKLCTDTC
ncbi:MAG: hypothetical protein QXH10_06075 [Ignisphaera sp.]|uniref:Uncharacterized protein n=1 Tax=Ignisphaera aggregans TaxID=334771 RepID=A0A7C4JJ13_9CREN